MPSPPPTLTFPLGGTMAAVDSWGQCCTVTGVSCYLLPPPSASRRPKKATKAPRAKQAPRLAKEGQVSRSMQQLSSHGLWDYSPTVHDQLSALRPEAATPCSSLSQVADGHRFYPEKVYEKLMFPSPGYQLRAHLACALNTCGEHFREMTHMKSSCLSLVWSSSIVPHQ